MSFTGVFSLTTYIGRKITFFDLRKGVPLGGVPVCLNKSLTRKLPEKWVVCKIGCFIEEKGVSIEMLISSLEEVYVR